MSSEELCPPMMALPSTSYNDLPNEVRTRIAKEFFKENKQRHEKTSPFARPKYACIDHAWRDVVERWLWESMRLQDDEVAEFERFWVGRRRLFTKELSFRVNVTDCVPQHETKRNMRNRYTSTVARRPGGETPMTPEEKVWMAFDKLFSTLSSCDHLQYYDGKKVNIEFTYDRLALERRPSFVGRERSMSRSTRCVPEDEVEWDYWR
jgi:hypothetical protein